MNDIEALCQHCIDHEERDLRDIGECQRMEAIGTLAGAARSATSDAARLARAVQRSRRDVARLRELCRRHREPLADYVARLRALLMAHYDGCRSCNYDEECNQCNADDDGDAHSCNCADGPGYGYQLHKTLEMAKAALKADSK